MVVIGSVVLLGAALAMRVPDLSRKVPPTRTVDVNQKAVPIIKRTPLAQEYADDVSQLQLLRSRSLDELILKADELELKWRKLDGHLYAQIMMEVCNAIANDASKDRRIRDLTENYVRLALANTGKFSWEDQYYLCEWLAYERPSSISDAAWTEGRREKALLWLQAWQRLEKEFDPSFDLNDRRNRPSMTIAPPLESNLPSGVAPEAIKDPKVRAEYEKAIAENEAKKIRVNKQIALHSGQKPFIQNAEKNLVKMYSQAPYDTNELKAYLNTYVSDRSERERIVDEVNKNISESGRAISANRRAEVSKP
jgi:hypothetical protein